MSDLCLAQGTPAGRLPGCAPVAVIDIGSNSVRLVIYEGLHPNFTTLFNEKVQCALGKGVASTGELAASGVEKALNALKRFRTLCDQMQLHDVFVIATAAVRDARNSQDFIREAESICRVPLSLLSGQDEALYAGLGVIAGIYQPDGLVGDLGGGSLELVEVANRQVGQGITLPLGGLTLQDNSNSSLLKSDRLVKDSFSGMERLEAARGRMFYAVGGTWRAFAKLHMEQMGYPLRVMNHYQLPAEEALAFARLLRRGALDSLQGVKELSTERQTLLPYGAVVLENIIRRMKPSAIVFSAFGVREGLLFSKLSPEQRQVDPLLAAVREFGFLRSRSPAMDQELIAWSNRFVESIDFDETPEEIRLRHAACFLSDVGWRVHPDYRGEQSMNIVINATFPAIDHSGKAFLAMVLYHRHEGISGKEKPPPLRELATTRILDHARVLAGILRIAFILAPCVKDILPQTALYMKDDTLVLELPATLADLASVRVGNRLKQLARLLGCGSEIVIKERALAGF